jgi:hypothetical protein
MVDREAESLRHDADHGAHLAAESDLPADDGGIGLELTLPLFVGDHEHWRRVFALVLIEQGASEHRWGPCHPKTRCRHLGDAH